MKFTISISAAALLVLASVVAASSSVAQTKQEVANIDNKVGLLNEHLKVNSLNYLSGLAVRQSSQDVIGAIKAGSKSASEFTGTATDAEAKEILQTLSGTEVKVKTAIKRMIALKEEFKKLGVLSLAQSSVKEFQTETHTFSAQLIKLAPAYEKQAANALAAKFNADLDECATAYNSEASGSASGSFGGAGQTGAGKTGAGQTSAGQTSAGQTGASSEGSALGQAGAKSGSLRAVKFGSN
ncbi:hypothetical protein NDA11_006673 [Ustilago hordei]|uniref:Cell wall protein n=1 Tax=Ustilago hordei TaxID=120017 RepID=I2FU28_USTHO|nr:uncharacterized protein UHO2_01612 [Ustilago hordei]KAJ1040580.1 hypothetical protein NDA10_006851 [Ustilago hordei]KAJ1583212.1 hypothetical protein NDA15_001542 [Ustilago hordei]KAJ1586843.1 hypothetical protein NDA11_006673 [Ustilago hordei]KAJ1591563.1 hypothetical protein NDA12_001062 [Ustilago hordei]KAJ1602738.1 hypothetical protein NDA14_000638 [Ustilago hordei]